MISHREGGGIAPHLRAAIEAACDQPGALRTEFQPIADLRRGSIAGYEALSRIAVEPQMGPDRWFGLAHTVGLGARLEAAAIRSALSARPDVPSNCFLTINVAPDALLADEVQAAFGEAGDLRGVVIELTEQAPVDDYALLLDRLAVARERGALIAVDDAGAGFASLTHITQLRPQLVKIDRAHVTGIDRDPAKVAAVQTLGELASRLDAWVVAEGVETRAELEVLLDLGVPLAQGWLLGRPCPAMTGATRALVAAHAARGARRAAGDLGELLQDVVCVGTTASAELLGRAFASAGEHGVVVVVDEHQRPLALRRRGDADGDDGAAFARNEALSVTLDTALTALVHRLLARPDGRRLDPVIACDGRGRAIGLITVERILQALTTAHRPAV